MILPDKKDAIHKIWLYRILEKISASDLLSGVLYFKGGTCASMLGLLDRFSVDLDFDYAGKTDSVNINKVRDALRNIFKDLDLTIKDESKKGIQFFLKYETKNNIIEETRLGRNTIKIDASFPLFKSTKYESKRLSEIDRVLMCQSIESMFSHKLVALVDRYEKTGHIAGRDIYDIHHFFMSGFSYDSAIIKERRNVDTKVFLSSLIDFIDKKVTDKIIDEDLGSLLSPEAFRKIRKILKKEVINFIKNEI